MNKKSFFIGIVLGALVAALTNIAFYWHRPLFPRPPRPEMMGKMMIERFAEDLELSPSQKETITPVMMGFHKKMLALKFAQNAEVEKLFSEVEKEIIPILSDKQKIRLEEHKQRMREMKAHEEKFMQNK